MASAMATSPVTLHAPRALLPETMVPGGWADGVRVSIDAHGGITAVSHGVAAMPGDRRLERRILLPAPCNLHSHAFQRALAGRTQRRGPGEDSFWSWRAQMYRFLERLDPEAIEAITAQAQVEMLEAGFAAVGEFHYLHHAPDGAPYANPAETSLAVMAAARATGIGLTHLPVIYTAGGVDGRPPEGGQRRFACDPERFARLHEAAREALADGPHDWRLGVAPHSLRAVPPGPLAAVLDTHRDGPVHIHVAEQTAEVAAIEAALGQRPVAWLLDHHDVGSRWCLVHATHMTPAETEALARTGAVAGLCPITEADLGDGLFDAERYLAAGGRLGIGTDSNVRITLAGELRLLEYGQRLAARRRNVLAETGASTARALLERALTGGARALDRPSGAIAEGHLADLLTLDADDLALHGLEGDALLDAWVFSAVGNPVREVWSAGRLVVADGRHHQREAVAHRHRAALDRLTEA
ncbi:MAG: formimidoylglutamate deiminase [Ectothiorhodospiraceae bacterium]|nr:formimidoylglutamate deiminase [Ectothiorhodospiraceae bacterium]